MEGQGVGGGNGQSSVGIMWWNGMGRAVKVV